MRADAAEGREGDCLNGKYQLEEMLGAGGMGEVYRAVNLGIGRVVAIKLLRPEFADRPSIVERFLREARAANIVRHKNVVEVLDIDKDDKGTPFIVQEYLEGEDLSAVLDRFPDGVPPGLALSVLAPIVEAVRAAHERGVVHRDLKPENVFLANIDGVVIPKVLDFGISKLPGTSDADVRLTGTHSIMGSPQYMSPEQILTPQDVDSRSDIWSLGVMLFQCLSGRVPFGGATAEVLFVQICRDDPMSLADAAPEVPEPLVQIVTRCLQREPARRFQNAVELSDALKQLRKSVRFSDSMVGSVGERGPIKPETILGRDDTRSSVRRKPGTAQGQGPGQPGVASSARPTPRTGAPQSGTHARPDARRGGSEAGYVSELPAPQTPTRATTSKRAPNDPTRVDPGRARSRPSAAPPAATGRTYQGMGRSGAPRATPSGRAREMDADLPVEDADNPLTLATRSGQTRPGTGGMHAVLERSAGPARPVSTSATLGGMASAAPVGPTGFDLRGMIASLQVALLVVGTALVAPWYTVDGLAKAQTTFGSQLGLICMIGGIVLGVASLTVVRVAQRFEAWSLYGASTGLFLEGGALGMLGISGGAADVGSLPALSAQIGPVAALLVAAGFTLYGLVRAREELFLGGRRGTPYGVMLLVLSLGGLLTSFRVAQHAMSVIL